MSRVHLFSHINDGFAVRVLAFALSRVIADSQHNQAYFETPAGGRAAGDQHVTFDGTSWYVVTFREIS